MSSADQKQEADSAFLSPGHSRDRNSEEDTEVNNRAERKSRRASIAALDNRINWNISGMPRWSQRGRLAPCGATPRRANPVPFIKGKNFFPPAFSSVIRRGFFSCKNEPVAWRES